MSEAESSNAPVGNYKGVMLCNRPFGGTVEAMENGLSESNAFKAGIVPDPWGINPVTKFRDDKRNKPVPAIVKHKQWLAELQKAKEMVKYQESLEEQSRDHRTMSFHKHEALLRSKVQQMVSESKEEGGVERKEEKSRESSNACEGPCRALPCESKRFGEAEESKHGGSAAPAFKPSSSQKERPKWSLTAQGNDEQEANAQEEEINDLLDFVEGLDFEDFVDDLEVRTALLKMRNRIEELSQPKQRTDDRLKPGDLRDENCFLREPEELERGDRAKDALADDGEHEDDEDVESIYSEMPSLRGIHSKSSLKEKIRQVESKRGEARALLPTQEEEEEEAENPGPRVVEVIEDGGTRISNKTYPGNLPYLHRNPAV